jgi:hypothetical protein
MPYLIYRKVGRLDSWTYGSLKFLVERYGDVKCKSKKKKSNVSVINYPTCHEDVWGNGGTVPLFLVLALDGGEWSASRRCHSGEKINQAMYAKLRYLEVLRYFMNLHTKHRTVYFIQFR